MKRLLRIFGLLLSTVPPALAILEYFPLWLSKEKTAVSALTLLLLLLAAIPLFRVLKRHFKTPAPWVVWLLLWLFLKLFLPIAEALKTVAFISFPTCLLGALCFHYAGKAEKAENKKEA